MHMCTTMKQPASPGSGITVRFPKAIREQVKSVAQSEHRSAAAYIEDLVERDLRHRDEADRIVRIYVSADAPDWTGTVIRGERESEEEHAERTAVLTQLFGTR